METRIWTGKLRPFAEENAMFPMILQDGRRLCCTFGIISESRPCEAATQPGKPIKMSQYHAESDHPMADETRMGVLQR